jgi:hypothetical protein
MSIMDHSSSEWHGTVQARIVLSMGAAEEGVGTFVLLRSTAGLTTPTWTRLVASSGPSRKSMAQRYHGILVSHHDIFSQYFFILKHDSNPF